MSLVGGLCIERYVQLKFWFEGISPWFWAVPDRVADVRIVWTFILLSRCVWKKSDLELYNIVLTWKPAESNLGRAHP
jgi:hypothetical protein